MIEDLQQENEKKASLVYLGKFSDRITTSLIGLVESYLRDREQLKKLSKKVSFLIVESFQNVIRHGMLEADSPHISQYREFFQVEIYDDGVIITSANIIEQQYVGSLGEKIDLVNSLDKKELTALSTDILRHGKLSAKGGASLGLIEMVRRSGLPLKKYFIPLSDEYAQVFLSFEISIREGFSRRTADISGLVGNYQSLINDNIMISYKGNFSNDLNINLVEMLRKNFVVEGDLSSNGIKTIMALIELIQNISKHAHSINENKSGTLTVKRKGNKMYLKCANFLKQGEALKKKLEEIKASSIDKIDKLYKSKLKEAEISEQGDGGLGLLEIARLTKNGFSYTLNERPDGLYYFTIQVNTE